MFFSLCSKYHSFLSWLVEDTVHMLRGTVHNVPELMAAELVNCIDSFHHYCHSQCHCQGIHRLIFQYRVGVTGVVVLVVAVIGQWMGHPIIEMLPHQTIGVFHQLLPRD